VIVAAPLTVDLFLQISDRYQENFEAIDSLASKVVIVVEFISPIGIKRGTC
jgi:hypothetical protein